MGADKRIEVEQEEIQETKEDVRKKHIEVSESDEQTTIPLEEEEEEEESKQRDNIQDRMGFYNLCRARKKPTKGQLKRIVFPKMKKEEDTGDYIKRAEKETGVKISSVGVMKRQKRNDPCSCKSGEKYKKCCGRG